VSTASEVFDTMSVWLLLAVWMILCGEDMLKQPYLQRI